MGGVSMEWKEVKIGDLGQIITGKTPKTAIRENWGGKIPFLSPSDDMSNKTSPVTARTLTELGVAEVAKCLIPANSICVSCIGSDLGKVVKTDRELVTNQQINTIVPHSNIDSDFVYYLMCIVGKELNYISKTSTAVPIINKSTFSDWDIVIPREKEDQRRIASILSSLDRKIELNNKINADLEEMAQAIFKNWFVDFEPFKDGKFVDSELGMIPEGWKVGTLGDFCKCLLGGTPSRSKEEYWNGEVNWINSGEINKFRILEASEKITELGLAKSATKLLPKKTTVLAITGATLGQVSLLEIDTCANQSVIGVLENTEIPYEYIYPFIKDRIEMLIQHQTGGAQQHINKDNVESLIFLLPAKNVLENYISLVGPMYKRIESQCFENLYLSTLRDTLLPRLMSGEIEVPE